MSDVLQQFPPLFIRDKRASSFSKRRGQTRIDYRRKLKSKLVLQDFSAENVWKGASEIVGYYVGESPNRFSILKSIKSETTNACICVSWPKNETEKHRYKLWKDVGEILYVPLYSGQIIDKEFLLEVWSVESQTIVAGMDNIYLSFLFSP